MSEPDAFDHLAAEMLAERPMLGVADFARRLGLPLTPWQELVLLDLPEPKGDAWRTS